MGGVGIVFLLLIILFIIIGLAKTIIIVPEQKVYVVESLGAYKECWGTGLHFKVPFLDRIARKVNMKEQVADFDPQPVITSDNVTMKIDSVVYFKISDARLYSYGIENPIAAIENLTATNLRNIIGSLDLDKTLTSRDIINTKMRAVLDEATDPWGIKVTRVEVKNIIPPEAIRTAMEKQMKAEREKRETITKAEGERQAKILEAEGNKEAAIRNAEASKQAKILAAEAEAESLRKVKEAEAEGIKAIKQAEADGIVALRNAGIDEGIIALRSLDALGKLGSSPSTKIVIPSEMQNMASLVASIKGVTEATDTVVKKTPAKTSNPVPTQAVQMKADTNPFK